MDKILRPDVLPIVLLLGLPMFAVVGHFVHQILKVRSDNELKRTMVERGMSAEEIERVLAAGSHGDGGKDRKVKKE